VTYLMEPKRYNQLIIGADGRYLPVYPKLAEDPFWSSKPALKGLIQIADGAISTYWPGKPNQPLAEIVDQCTIIKWVQKMLVDRMPAAEAVGKAQEEMVAIFKRYGQPV